MAENMSHPKLKKRKPVLSDSEDEVLKKHKIDDSDEMAPRDTSSSVQVLEKDVMDSGKLSEQKQNGKYEKSIEDGLSDSDSAGTDIELTSDEDITQNYQRAKKKRKTCIKNERKSRNSVQNTSSSESDDDRQNSPMSPSSLKKSYRRRRTISGNKPQNKNSTDSESYKTDSESDEEPLKRKLNKGSPPHNRVSGKKGSGKSQQLRETSSSKSLQKNKIDSENGDSENNALFQKPVNHSSSDDSKQVTKKSKSSEQLNSKSNKNPDMTTDSKKSISKETESSRDECLGYAGSQSGKQTEESIKQEVADSKDDVRIQSESENENAKNSDVAKNESMTESSDNSDSEPKIKHKTEGKLHGESIHKGKSVKKEENSSSSGTELSDEKVPLKRKPPAKHSEKRRKSGSSSSSAARKKTLSNSSSDSGSERPKKEKRQRNKLPDEDKRIISLKKYLKVAGIRVHNYAELWKDCRSNKARAEKMLSLLEKNGLKGRPTIEKCKRLKKKIETRKEVEELDLANVMDCGEGRTRRSRLRTSGSQDLPEGALQKSSELKKRLRVLGDSDSDVKSEIKSESE